MGIQERDLMNDENRRPPWGIQERDRKELRNDENRRPPWRIQERDKKELRNDENKPPCGKRIENVPHTKVEKMSPKGTQAREKKEIQNNENIRPPHGMQIEKKPPIGKNERQI